MNPAVPALHGHRGARGHKPENTLASIGFAINMGANAAEMDLCVTADNAVVVHHDLSLSPLLTRDARGNWIEQPVPIRQQTRKSLQRYNVGQIRPGTEYQKRFHHQQPMGYATIPTLSAVIEFVLQHAEPDFVFNLELKGSPHQFSLTPAPGLYVSLVLDLIHHYGIGHRVFLQSFDWQLIRLAHERNPKLLTGLLTDMQPDANPKIPDPEGDTTWTDGISLAQFDGSVAAMIKAAGSDVWSSNHHDLSQHRVNQAHQLGLKVYAWTVNQVEDMQRMIDWGVDAITTDYPDRLAALLNKS